MSAITQQAMEAFNNLDETKQNLAFRYIIQLSEPDDDAAFYAKIRRSDECSDYSISKSHTTRTQEQINVDLEFWEKIDILVDESGDEVLSMDDFRRTKISRELIIFDDED